MPARDYDVGIATGVPQFCNEQWDLPPTAGTAKHTARLRRDPDLRQNDLDTAIKQVRVLLLRADQLSDVITERRRSTYARQLMERTRSVLDPMLWIGAAKALPGVVDIYAAWRADGQGAVTAIYASKADADASVAKIQALWGALAGLLKAAPDTQAYDTVEHLVG